MSPASGTFAQMLKETTRAAHGQAESSRFITELMQGARSARDYVLLLTQYRPLYAALETACARWRSQDSVRSLFDPALERLGSIDQDLAHLQDFLELDRLPEVTPAARTYAQRIAVTGAMPTPERLVAHHYLRYLGDLSGGQAIGALVARHYGIPASMLTMWSFPTISKPKVYKDDYRELLNIFATTAESELVVREATRGFTLNQDLFVELGNSSPAPELETV